MAHWRLTDREGASQTALSKIGCAWFLGLPRAMLCSMGIHVNDTLKEFKGLAGRAAAWTAGVSVPARLRRLPPACDTARYVVRGVLAKTQILGEAVVPGDGNAIRA